MGRWWDDFPGEVLWLGLTGEEGWRGEVNLNGLIIDQLRKHMRRLFDGRLRDGVWSVELNEVDGAACGFEHLAEP